MKIVVTLFAVLTLSCIAAAHPSGSASQGHFRWRNDDGSQTSATWRQMEVANDTLTARGNIRLRVELYNVSTLYAFTGTLALFYSPDGVTYTQITTDGSTNAWKLSPSANFTNGDGTTVQFGGDYFSNYQSGLMIQSSSSFSINLPAITSSEYEFCITPTANAVSPTTYRFQIQYSGGGVIDHYDTYPTLLYAAPGAITYAATLIQSSAARLHGGVAAGGNAQTVHFLYGTSSGVYTDSANGTPHYVTGYALTSDSTMLTGLAPNTTYYYVVSATSEAGYLRGSEQSFTTVNPLGGYALQFNGTNSYLQMFTGNMDNYTLEMWVKFDSTADQGIICRTSANGPFMEFSHSIWIQSKHFVHYTYDGNANSVTETDTVMAGTWYHVAVTATSFGVMKLFVNGVEEGSELSINEVWTGGDRYDIGVSAPGYFKGIMDEVRIWNRALPGDTIAAWMNMGVTPSHPDYGNLVAYYRFDQNSGTVAYDSSGNGSNATLYNSPLWVASTAPINDNYVPLPVELTSFAANGGRSSVELSWKTATETQNAGFEVDRANSNQQSATKNWTKVGFVSGTGTSNAPHSYSFTDNVGTRECTRIVSNRSTGTERSPTHKRYRYRLEERRRSSRLDKIIRTRSTRQRLSNSLCHRTGEQC